MERTKKINNRQVLEHIDQAMNRMKSPSETLCDEFASETGKKFETTIS